MSATRRLAVRAPAPDGPLRAFEPSLDEVRTVAGELCRCYNDEHNRAMLGHSTTMSAEDVVACYEALWEEGGHPLLLEQAGALVGDADLRNVQGDEAEFAILIGARSRQGQGLGTRFGVLVHALGFRGLGLRRTYASVIPANEPSLRLMLRLGYRRDDSPPVRARAEAPDDVVLVLERADFEEAHAESLAQLAVAERAD
ncbi:MAG: GNAT family N-acetyltransferase [Deltaproteobacteria bacterium]|nr:GNAT family N-acetyltransferase [Deltaproteobacteria bacterium]